MSISKSASKNIASEETSKDVEYADIFGTDGQYISDNGDSGEAVSMKETHPTIEVEQQPQQRKVKRTLFSPSSSSSNNAQKVCIF